MNWQHCLAAAQVIVQAERELYPGCEGARNGGGGGSSGNFSRTGSGLHERYYDVPSSIATLVNQNAASAGLDPSLGAEQNQEYTSLMNETPEGQPGFASLLSAANISPTEYSGRSTLTNMSNIDPFSGDFEAATDSAYRSRASEAMAQAASGPEAVRGGDARTGIAWSQLADQLSRQRGGEVRQAQLQDAQLASGAANSMADIEQKRTDSGVKASLGLSQLASGVADRGLGAAAGVDRTKQYNLQMLQLVAGLMGKTLDKQTDDFQGEGDQSGWQAGLSCCFIFMEACGTPLPWYVELGRFEFFTHKRERGYKWMASWLVPLMQRSKVWRAAVQFCMIKPFLRYGAWYYGEANKGWVAWPVCQAWFAVWQSIGTLKKG